MQLELLPPATQHEHEWAVLKRKIGRLQSSQSRIGRKMKSIEWEIFQLRQGDNPEQLRLKLIHRVGQLTGRLAELIEFDYQSVRYQVHKGLNNPMVPLMVIREVLGFEVDFHRIYFTDSYRVSV